MSLSQSKNRRRVGLLSSQHPETKEISNPEITVKMEENICQYSKFGYCKLKDLCKKYISTMYARICQAARP